MDDWTVHSAVLLVLKVKTENQTTPNKMALKQNYKTESTVKADFSAKL